MINYTIENDLSVGEFKTVLINSNLGTRRPVNDIARLEKMLEHGNLVVTARLNEKLIGVARALTDFSYCTYLSDLAVDENYQRNGVGTELIRQVKLAAPTAKLIILSAPAAISYYPKIGFSRHEYCFFLDDLNNLK
ncbi:MAG: GNAT family N-acetyltransferase [Thalassobius sp.]|nr:GNAT family N-acetyltransferase [Thalassovita sp.]